MIDIHGGYHGKRNKWEALRQTQDILLRYG